MKDINGIEIKTGDVVEIKNAYFKNDNGLYFVEKSPKDAGWLGSDYCLKKITKKGTLSKAKKNICFYPISVYVNNSEVRAEANKWNKEHATIEIKYGVNQSEIAEYFEQEAINMNPSLKHLYWNWGEESEIYIKNKAIQKHYEDVAKRLRGESTEEVIEELAEEIIEEEVETVKESKGENMKKLYIASVRDKETKETMLIERECETKKEFQIILKDNNYTVYFITTEEKFDEDCAKYHEKQNERKAIAKYVRKAMNEETKRCADRMGLTVKEYKEYYKLLDLGCYILAAELIDLGKARLQEKEVAEQIEEVEEETAPIETKEEITDYEMNGYHLFKSYLDYIEDGYTWAINKEGYFTEDNIDTTIYVDSFEDGMKQLVTLTA